MPDVRTRVVSFDTTEGTFMNVDVSPDGKTLVFDLLGDLYSVPIEGGEAVALTSGSAWDQAPRFSPDGKQLYFVSDREGHKNLWRLTLFDQSLQQITQLDTDILGGPNWSQNGSTLLAGVVVANAISGEVILHSIDPTTGDTTRINAPNEPWIWIDAETFEKFRTPIQVYSGVESADGKVFYSETELADDGGHQRIRLYEFDRRTQRRAVITAADATYDEYKPQLSHDGTRLAYFRQYSDRHTELRILDRVTGQDRALVALPDTDDAEYTHGHDSHPNYAFTPDDRSVIFWHGGKIHRVSLVDGFTKIVPFLVKVSRAVWPRAEPPVIHLSDEGEAGLIRWPSVSRNGKTMVFAATGYVWIRGLETGQQRRLTGSSDFEYMPALSPDGRSIAYISFEAVGDEYGAGRLIIADIDSGRFREVHSDPGATYLLPAWSHDGSMIALIRETDGENGTEVAFGWMPATGGTFHKVALPEAYSRRASHTIYARYVGFDTAGDRLLFSYPESTTKSVLVASKLAGGGTQTLATGTSEVGGIVPAPDLKHLALTRHDGTVWIIPFDVGEEAITVSSLSSDTWRVSEIGGYYVDWSDPERLTFGLGKNVYDYGLHDRKLQSVRVGVPIPKPKFVQPVAFTNARLITMSDQSGAGPVIEVGTVVLDGMRIAAIGPASTVDIPEGALVIDATGKTILPGLLDTHYHGIGGRSASAFALPNPYFSDESAINFGITSAWEPGGPVADGVPSLVDLQAAGRIDGPRWSHALQGGVGRPYELLTSYAQALASAEQHRELGVAVLKEYNVPTRRQRQWLSVAARESGLGIVAHLESFDGMMTRIVDGFTGGDHPTIPVPFYKDVHELLRQTGYIWTPNVLITGGTIGEREDRRRFYCHAVVNKRKKGNFGFMENVTNCEADTSNSPTVPYESHRVGRVARQAALAAERGSLIGVSAHNMPGSELHREMWLLWRGGMPIEDVLRATTMTNAEKLGLQEEIGSLEVGKMADFLVLDENPLDDILNTLSLRYTVQGGVVYDSATAKRIDVSSLAREAEGQTTH